MLNEEEVVGGVVEEWVVLEWKGVWSSGDGVYFGRYSSGGVDVEGDAWHGKSGVGDRAR